MKLNQYQTAQLEQSLKNMIHSLAVEYDCGVFGILENIHKGFGPGTTTPTMPSDFAGLTSLVEVEDQAYTAYRHDATNRILVFEYSELAEAEILQNSYTIEEFEAQFHPVKFEEEEFTFLAKITISDGVHEERTFVLAEGTDFATARKSALINCVNDPEDEDTYEFIDEFTIEDKCGARNRYRCTSITLPDEEEVEVLKNFLN